MAEFSDTSDIDEWRYDLNSHAIFQKLRQQKSCIQDDPKVQPEGLMFVHEGQIFVWDKDNSSLLTASLRDILVNDQTLNTLQELLCISAPIFEVEHLALSPTGQHVLLSGKRGASVLELPRRHGKHGLFEGGKVKINCRVTGIAERFFISNSTVTLLKAAWYPGSSTGMHLAFLTSDNFFRLYDTRSPLKPVQTHRLGSHATSYALSTSHSTFDAALGEIAIAFDFGPPSEAPQTAGRGRGGDQEDSLIHPVFVLRGNGDIYVLNTSLTDVRYSHTKLQGPLTMHPPAEDNYGMDACSLCCLASSPPVLVVATSSGLLHHCIVVAGETEDRDDASSIHSSDLSSISSLALSTSSFSLFVYETVELTRCPVSVDDYDGDISYPIMLHADISCGKRYFCSHSGGVHGLLLPWLGKLEEFCQDEGAEEEDSLQEVGQDQPCVVRHMICTMPSDTCPTSPPLGLAVIMDQLLGNILLCMTQTRECMTTPLSPVDVKTPPALISEGRGDEPAVSPLRQTMSEPFHHYIKRLLQRSHSNPILKTSSKTQLGLEECFQLLLRATKTLREEYIHRQDTVREEMEKRVKILKQQKEQQLADIAECQQFKAEISRKAEKLAERHGDAEEKQEELINRVGVVLHTLQSQLPILSEAEQNMRTELESLTDKMDHLKKALDQVKAKKKYQDKYKEKEKQISNTPALSQNQEKNLRKILTEQTEEISSLIAEVQNLATVVGP
ncbi:nuclear pore complex protein Nup88-like [Diadema antillarum]|uniref:nuclear pore complex protein Nup88-like n=1 Tax=Diadema antillarum TaxID=105358 RepID=UPI003A896E2C